ncbi:MAG: DUF1592 domain-containing protein [Planctomycetota bacterium]
MIRISLRQRFSMKFGIVHRTVLILCLFVYWRTDSRGADALAEHAFARELAPLLQTYCFDCHQGENPDGELRLDLDESAEAIAENRKVWMRAVAQVRLGSMPPEYGAELDPETRKKMVRLIDELATAVNCVQNPNAGKVALRRLTKTEYRNTIRDLTGVDYTPARHFPGDDVGYGFDNIGDVLSLPPLLMEKYLDAAEFIVGEAIATAPPAEIFEIDKAPGSLIGVEKFSVRDRLTMASNGTVALQTKIPFAGTYTLTLTASGDQGGDQPVMIEVQYGKRVVPLRVTASPDSPAEHSVRLRLSRGNRKIEIRFVNDHYVAGKIDRNFHLHHVNLRGVQKRSVVSADKLPASHRHLIFTYPRESEDPEVATRKVLSRFASRAFRRPATKREVDRLARLTASVRGDGASYVEAIQVGMQAVLVSPHFLFKVETPRRVRAGQPMPEITDYELATRISYFLWSSMPDDELLSMAHKGEIRDRGKLLRKVGKMIADPRASRFVENFAGQWLQLRNLQNVAPDELAFRDFSDEIREAMKMETLVFFNSVLKSNSPVTTLLDAKFTYLNEDLAKFYGIYNVKGDEFVRVSLEGTPRGGLLTHASVLTVTSNPTRTSPVKRGKWILENLLNTPPPPAPPNIPELEKGKLVGTLRERMEQHRSDPACAACHDMMDPLGFALENFDAVGKWRTRDGRDLIDASGRMPDGTEFDGIDELRTHLSTERREQFVRCLTEKMLTYAVGRGTEYYDRCAIDEIVEQCRTKDFKFAYLIAAIIESDPFQKQGFRE